jgi:hypothetical protein
MLRQGLEGVMGLRWLFRCIRALFRRSARGEAVTASHAEKSVNAPRAIVPGPAVAGFIKRIAPEERHLSARLQTIAALNVRAGRKPRPSTPPRYVARPKSLAKGRKQRPVFHPILQRAQRRPSANVVALPKYHEPIMDLLCAA